MRQFIRDHQAFSVALLVVVILGVAVGIRLYGPSLGLSRFFAAECTPGGNDQDGDCIDGPPFGPDCNDGRTDIGDCGTYHLCDGQYVPHVCEQGGTPTPTPSTSSCNQTGDNDHDCFLPPEAPFCGNDCNNGDATIAPGSCPALLQTYDAECGRASSVTPTPTATSQGGSCTPGGNDQDGDCIDGPPFGPDCNDGTASIGNCGTYHLCNGQYVVGACSTATVTPTATFSSTPTPSNLSSVCDQDGDGYRAANTTCHGNDCNDSSAAIAPGSCPELLAQINGTPTPTVTVFAGAATPTPNRAPTCAVLGGTMCSTASACPAGFKSAGQSFDCAACCLPQVEPTPTPSGLCGPIDLTSSQVLAQCSKGDCDNDRFKSPGAGGIDCNDADSCQAPGVCPSVLTAAGIDIRTNSEAVAHPEILNLYGLTPGTPATPTPLPPPVESHLECQNQACVAVSGSGGSSCNSAGATCGASQTAQSGGDQLRALGVRVNGNFREELLQDIARQIRAGNIRPSAIYSTLDYCDKKTGGQCSARGAKACVVSNGSEICYSPTVSTGEYANFSGITAHELVHVKQFQDAGFKSYTAGLADSESFDKLMGQRDGVTGQVAVSCIQASAAGDLALEAAAYSVSCNSGNWAPIMSQNARDFGGRVADLNNFGIDFLRTQGLSFSNNFSHFASVVYGMLKAAVSTTLHDSTLSVLSSETLVSQGGDTLSNTAPTAVFFDPIDGARTSAASVLVHGGGFSAGGGKAIIDVRLTLNNAPFVTLPIAPATICQNYNAAGVCYGWLIVAPLREGVNTISASVTDSDGVKSDASTILVTRSSALAAVVSQPGIISQIAGQIKTGPGQITLLAFLVAGIASLLYSGYTRTGLFRRRELKEYVKEGQKDARNPDFKL